MPIWCLATRRAGGTAFEHFPNATTVRLRDMHLKDNVRVGSNPVLNALEMGCLHYPRKQTSSAR
jgi:hypothetical protein